MIGSAARGGLLPRYRAPQRPHNELQASLDRPASPATLTATAILLLQWTLPTIGFALLISERGPVRGSTVVLLAPLLFLTGVFASSRVRRRHSDDRSRTDNWLPPFLRACVLVLGALSIVHFAAVGIPVLSSDVETSRFDVGSSGLGGFPSRAVLYALPVAALVALSTVTSHSRRPTLQLWALFAITQIALGFKGGLIEVLIVTALGLAIRYGRLGLRQCIGLAAGGMVALAYVAYVGSKYQTLAGSEPGLSYIVRRSTSDAIIAGYTALTTPPWGITPNTSVFARDLSVLFGRYLGVAPDGYSFDELVSSVVTGTPIQRGAFLVPVTVGGPVYMLYSMPVLLCVLALVTLGFIWHDALLRLGIARGASKTIGAGVVVYGLRLFLMNGNGAYLLINLTFTFGILLICAVLSRIATGDNSGHMSAFTARSADH